jgi:hypothetical protein
MRNWEIGPRNRRDIPFKQYASTFNLSLVDLNYPIFAIGLYILLFLSHVR